ncbi:MAG: PAS domain-containing protein [Bernardetiaceae bacterium]|nr:PAS domain-containing protein [Bernardetiaceae bacterium]
MGSLVEKSDLRRLALVAEKTENMVIITNASQQIEWVNDGFTRVTGYGLAECQGQRPSFLQGQDSDALVIARMRQNLSAHRPFTEEILNYTKQAQPYWVRLYVSPLFDDEGELEGYISIQNDITRERAQNERLIQSESWFRAIYDSTSDVNVFLDPQGRILAFNRRARHDVRDLFGKSLEVGRLLTDYSHPAEQPDFFRDFDLALSGQTIQLKREIHITDDFKLWFEVRFVPVRDDADQIIGVCFNAHNIDHERRNEERILEQHQQLAEFAFLTAHKLRAPLASVLGLAQLLALGGLEVADKEDIVQKLIGAAETLDQVMREMTQSLTPALYQKIDVFNRPRRKRLVRNVMLVDDDPLVNLITQRLLIKYQPDVSVKFFLRLALDLLRDFPEALPDVILLDIVMPEVNGWQFLEALETLQLQCDVFMLSSSINPADYQKSQTYANVRGFIHKPLNAEKMQVIFD